MIICTGKLNSTWSKTINKSFPWFGVTVPKRNKKEKKASTARLVNLTPNRTYLFKFAVSVCFYIVLPRQQSSRVSWWLRRPPFSWRMLCSRPRVGKHLSLCCVRLKPPPPARWWCVYSLCCSRRIPISVPLTLGKWVGTRMRCDSLAFLYTHQNTKENVCKQRPCDGL